MCLSFNQDPDSVNAHGTVTVKFFLVGLRVLLCTPPQGPALDGVSSDFDGDLIF